MKAAVRPAVVEAVNIYKGGGERERINRLLSIRDCRFLHPSTRQLRRTLTVFGRHEACCPLLGLTALNLSLGGYFETVHQRRTPAGCFIDRPNFSSVPLPLYLFFFVYVKTFHRIPPALSPPPPPQPQTV